MNTILTIILALSAIDGHQLFLRSQRSKSGAAYSKFLKQTRDKALNTAWIAAESGQTRIVICFDNPFPNRSAEEFHQDIARIFMRVSGISFWPSNTFNTNCFTLDWSQAE